ncbi:hypothetical protein MLD38_029269 [Melastoma candidum]|uniref:Uncharacterized protein n=1 Tax=Melastoma candidum TaxID=119954 RepID=A0ACB9N905_9MYRT|nr:hypothetical protein MLD38_029269 [Melastoma candidum]
MERRKGGEHWLTDFGACSGGWAGIKCVQRQVIVLHLPWKSLGGRLTEKIGQFQALRKLSLHDNVIGGPIPSALGFLPNLRGVQLFNNRFAGSIPPSLGDCPLLQTLDVSNNPLTGSIPESLANCTKLYRLNVSFNSISGSVPVGVISSPSLFFLAVQDNNISGSIPEVQTRTGKKAQFQLRSLAANHSFISGLIPVAVGNLPILQILDLSFNSINGSLLPTSSNLSSLVLLNLGGNSLDTRIPEIFNKVHNLSVLNLKGNRYIGRSILSPRRDQATDSMDGGGSPHHRAAAALEVELNNFQRQVADRFVDLSGCTHSQLLSLPWIRKLLDIFLCCKEDFRVLLFNNKALLSKPPMDRMISDFYERSIKSLDVYNAIRDGIDQIRQWQRLLEIAHWIRRRIWGRGSSTVQRRR